MGSTLGLAIESKGQTQQRSANHDGQNHITSNDVPDNRQTSGDQLTSFSQQSCSSDSSSSLDKFLLFLKSGVYNLSKMLWLREQESNLHLQGESLASYHYLHPAIFFYL